LAQRLETVTVCAKVSPAQKSRIIEALHLAGHVVGFLGDGINDGPALKSADVGISVDTAVDIARESADIILLEKSLLVRVHKRMFLSTIEVCRRVCWDVAR
jgi:Mg2+-importing ATPase